MQSVGGVSGTFTTTFPNSSFDRTGAVSGTAHAATATGLPLFLTPSTPLACGLSGTMGGPMSVLGVKLTGSYSAVSCAGAVTGTLDLTLQ